MKKLLPSLLLASAIILSGCTQEERLNIEFIDYAPPTAYVGEEYNFADVLKVESGVKYKLDVYVCDYLTMTEKVLEVRNKFYFTPLEPFDVSVVVTASKGRLKSVKTKPIPVSIKGDPVDELLVTGGFSGYSDNGIHKELVTDEKYIKGENSNSSIYASFQGSNLYTWGAAIMSLNNFRLLEYWSDKEWDNAVVHFWVFNPNEEALLFQLRIADDYTKMVDVDWGNSLNTERIAAPGEWTEIVFSLRHYGVDHTLYENEEGTRHDSLNVKIKYAGAPTVYGETYSYQLYIDDVDISPYSKEKFPDLDTECYAKAETLEYGWENMFLDQGWTSSNVVFDRYFVNSSQEQESKSSMSLSFKNATAEKDNGYAVILCPEEQFQAEDEMPSLRHGTLDLDVHFSSDVTNKTIMVIAVQREWTFTARYSMNPETTSNEWMHLSIDLATYPVFDSISSCIRLGFGFPGINTSNKNTAVIHIDNIKFNQDAGTPEKPEPETLMDGWENMPLDDGWTTANVGFDYSNANNTEQHPSKSSMILTFDNVEPDPNNGYAVIFSPEEIFKKDELPCLNDGVLEFDVKFSNDVSIHTIKTIGTHSNWTAARIDVDPLNETGEWLHYSIDFASISEFSFVTSCIRLGIGFNGVTSSNKNSAVIHLDNVFFNGKD